MNATTENVFTEALSLPTKERAVLEWWPILEARVRECRIVPFPYRLPYRDLPDRIQIVAVLHFGQRPGSWRDRLK
jgi:hypothetical protein